MDPTKKPLPPGLRLDSLKHVHIIGVCGTLMGAFAAFLTRQGIRVTGSDQNVYPPMSDVLRGAGVVLLDGFQESNLTVTGKRPDLVVVGNVISRSNPEAAAAIAGDYVYASLPEAMEQIMLQKTRNIVISGTHGKTTTSCMMAHVLVKCGLDPSYFFGGVAHSLANSFHVAGVDVGRPFVIEGDEYDTAFWDKVPKFNHYLPDDMVLTSVEYDHADIYPDLLAIKRAFSGLVDRVRPGGRIIACLDYEVIAELVSRANVPVITYGSPECTRGPRFRAGKITADGEVTRFEVLEAEKSVEELSIRLPGKHNVVNALAVWIEARELGLESAKIRAALADFQGVKRRQETRGEVRGITVIDDFAHHPTAVRETIRALKLKYPDRRFVAVFEPRSATSRRKIFQREYVQALLESDVCFIASPFDQSKIPLADQFSSEQLASDVTVGGKQATVFREVEQGVADVAAALRPGDVVAVMSNGGFGGFIPKLLEALKR